MRRRDLLKLSLVRRRRALSARVRAEAAVKEIRIRLSEERRACYRAAAKQSGNHGREIAR